MSAVDGMSDMGRSGEGNTRNHFAWPSDTDDDSLAQKVEQRRVDTEAEVGRLRQQLAGAVATIDWLREELKLLKWCGQACPACQDRIIAALDRLGGQ